MAKVFFSYSHQDKVIRSNIDKHFSVLKRSKVIETWYDYEIPAGDDFDKVIKEELEEADIILLLISADFLDSSYCHDVEMKRALQKYKTGETKVVAIIVDTCDWKHTELKKLKSLPEDGRAIKSYGKRSEAYQHITDEIRSLARSVNSPTHQLVKTVASSSSGKARSSILLSVKIISFIKRNYKPLGILIVVIWLGASLVQMPPIPSLAQQSAESMAFNQTAGTHAIEWDFNLDGYLDKVSFLSFSYPNNQQGLYIFLSDKNTQQYTKAIHKTGDIWNNRTPYDAISLGLDSNDLVVNFNFDPYTESEHSYEVTLSFANDIPIVSNYVRKSAGNLICKIDYLSGKYTIHGSVQTYPSLQVGLQEWRKGITPPECY